MHGTTSLAGSRLASRAYPLAWCLAAASTGIVCDRLWPLPPVVWAVAIGISATAWGWLRHAQRHRASAWCVLLMVMALSGAWHHDRWYLYADDELARFAGRAPQSVVLLADVVGVPAYRPPALPSPLDSTVRGPTCRVLVHACSVRDGDTWQPVSGVTTVTIPGKHLAVGPGDRVRVIGELYRLSKAANPGEPDYAAMTRGQRRLCYVLCRHAECLQIVRRAVWLRPTGWFGRLRRWGSGVLDRHVGPAEAPLAAALVLGQRRGLDDQTVQAFLCSGTLHLLAISGLHVGILASLAWLWLRLEGWPRPALLLATALMVIGFALLTGMRTPILRATLLVLGYCFARAVGRQAPVWNLLAAAALVNLAWTPAALWQPGAQLSFLAVATIFRAWPWLTAAAAPDLPTATGPAVDLPSSARWWARWGRAWRIWFSGDRPSDPLDQLIVGSRPRATRFVRAGSAHVARLTALSAVVWCVSAPIVAAQFHVLAPIAIILNVVLWIPFSLAMIAGLLTLLTASLVPPLAAVCGMACAAMLQLINATICWAAAVPGGHWWLAGPSTWWLVPAYGGLIVGAVYAGRIMTRWRWHLLLVWLAIGLAASCTARRVWSQTFGRTPCATFIAVGHGVAVLIELPDGRNLLYDAGKLGHGEDAAAAVAAVLWYRRISHLDAMVLSHADVDHFNAAPGLLRRFSVGGIYVSPQMFRRRAPAVVALRQAIEAARTPLVVVDEGIRFRVGRGASVTVLHPPWTGCGSTDNSNSVVISVDIASTRILLPGDLEGPGLEELLAEMPCHYDIVLAPHHGSVHSDPQRVVDWATPAWLIVSDVPRRSARAARLGLDAPAVRVHHLGDDGALQLQLVRGPAAVPW